MPTITVPEATYQRLAARAAAMNTTVDALALPAIESAAATAPSAPQDLSPDE